MLRRQLVPLLDRVVVKKASAQTMVGGIALPESAQKKVNEGEVVAVGPGALSREGKNIPIPLKEGDVVLLSEYGGTKVDLGDESADFVIYREEDILGVLKPE